jgi:hypothetical protein
VPVPDGFHRCISPPDAVLVQIGDQRIEHDQGRPGSGTDVLKPADDVVA